jgi:hypothetical protein
LRPAERLSGRDADPHRRSGIGPERDGRRGVNTTTAPNHRTLCRRAQWLKLLYPNRAGRDSRRGAYHQHRGGWRRARVDAMNINDTNRRIALDAITTSLRNVTSIRDFVAAVEVGGKVAADMLQETEAKLLDILHAIGEGE